MTVSQQVLFCARYLSERGYNSQDFDDLVNQSKKLKADYNLVKKEPTTFFTELAEKLRELWPAGEKDGMYPWRDSVPNLRKRLIELWATRFPDKTYSIEECLTVARKYLSQFQDDTKYMRVLKYFILKQKVIKDANGKDTHYDESIFADMLESNKDILAAETEFTYDSTYEEGVLI